ncbi:MAG: hypothetical protein WB765_08775 [Acidimicrobiales bacterium]
MASHDGPAPPAALGAQISHIFNYSGATQDWTVPAGVHLAHFDVRGAQGDANDVFGISVISLGEGGRTVAEIRVVPGEVIHMIVGGKGGDGGTCSGHAPPAEQFRGGFNGGGNGGGCHKRGDRGWGRGRSVRHPRRGHAVDQPRHRRRWGRRFVKLAVRAVRVLSVGGGGGHEGAHGVAAVGGCIGGTGGTTTSGGAQADYPEVAEA